MNEMKKGYLYSTAFQTMPVKVSPHSIFIYPTRFLCSHYQHPADL